MARDIIPHGSLRRHCAAALGRLGEKETAAQILKQLYLDRENKMDEYAKMIYSNLWEVTNV